MKAGIWCAVSSDAQAQEDKISIEDQEAKARQLCEAHGWQVVDVFRVVHSRFYIDIHDLNHDMKKAGNDALDRLMRHWSARDLDVLIVRDSTRLGRMQTLVMHMVESTIASGAKIYSLLDGGLVDENNYRIWAMMGGFKAATEMDRLNHSREIAYRKKVEHGLYAGPKPGYAHRAVRDPDTGKVIGLELNPEFERLWLDIATLIIEGVGWARLGIELYNRFGHTRKGKPYRQSILYTTINNPQFWGHTAYGIMKNQTQHNFGLWRIEPGHPVPEGVVIYYNTIEPALKGDLAQRVKEALHYRSEQFKGRRNKATTKRFSGLFICAHCGYTLRWTKIGYKCFSTYVRDLPDCPQSTYTLRPHVAQSYVEAILERVIAVGTPEIEHTSQNPLNAEKTKLGLVAREIRALEQKASRVIDLLSSGHEQLIEMYEAQLTTINDQLRLLNEEHNQLQTRVSARQSVTHTQQRAFDDLIQDGIEAFWQRDNTHINRVLHGMMMDNRIAVRDGIPIGIAIKPRKNRR